MNILHDLTAQFIDKFATNADIHYFFAPGRINLIGEHLDYNGGNVFPCALDIGTYAAVSPRSDKQFCLSSANFAESGIIQFSMDKLVRQNQHTWVNYPKGVIQAFCENKYKITHGLNIFFYGNIPHNSGLSSSASIEVLTGIILKSCFNLEQLDMPEIARLGQMAENNFVGVNCGIMDQFASAMGKKNNALLLNCATLSYKYAPLNLNNYKLVIGNTNKRRKLADSKYNQRVNECQQALSDLQINLAIKSLCDIDEETLLRNRNLIKNQVNYSRAYHVISENARTLQAFTALENNDLVWFGELLKQSHTSLRDFYAVTGVELDTMVNAAWQHPGCIGSRMTGAGMGGCTVSLVEAGAVDDFITFVSEQYIRITGLKPEFYVVNTSDGAKELRW